MKKALLLTICLSTFGAISVQQAQAQAHSHFIKIPATEAEIWTEIGDQQTKLAAVVKARDLGGAHDHGYAIRDLVKALPGMVAADQKEKAEAGAKEMTKLADALDKASAAKSQKATEASAEAMDVAVASLKADLEVK